MDSLNWGPQQEVHLRLQLLLSLSLLQRASFHQLLIQEVNFPGQHSVERAVQAGESLIFIDRIFALFFLEHYALNQCFFKGYEQLGFPFRALEIKRVPDIHDGIQKQLFPYQVLLFLKLVKNLVDFRDSLIRSICLLYPLLQGALESLLNSLL